MSYLIVGIMFCLLVYAGFVSERNAVDRRKYRFTSRQPTSTDEWAQSIPSIDRDTIENLLPIIGTGLKIPHEYLRPTDSFDVELNLKDRFWCLIVDDDSRDTIGDEFDMRYNERPSCEWADLRDVVLETSPIHKKHVG